MIFCDNDNTTGHSALRVPSLLYAVQLLDCHTLVRNQYFGEEDAQSAGSLRAHRHRGGSSCWPTVGLAAASEAKMSRAARAKATGANCMMGGVDRLRYRAMSYPGT